MWLAKSAGPDHGGSGRPGQGLLSFSHSQRSPGSVLATRAPSELQSSGGASLILSVVFINVPFGGGPFFGIHCAEGTGLETGPVEPAPEPCGWPGPSRGEAVDGRAFRMRTVSSWFLARRQICQSARVSVLHPLRVCASQLRGPLGGLTSPLSPPSPGCWHVRTAWRKAGRTWPCWQLPECPWAIWSVFLRQGT